MNYMDVMQSANPLSVLNALKIEATMQGAYVLFPCLKCQAKAVIKAYGDKKNVMYCPNCKATGQIIKMVMEMKNIDWEEAKKFLKDFMPTSKKIDKELGFEYELIYTNHLEQRGLSKEFCEQMGIGKPKGKIGMIRSPTTPDTTFPVAAPMMTPTACASALDLVRNALKSWNISSPSNPCHLRQYVLPSGLMLMDSFSIPPNIEG